MIESSRGSAEAVSSVYCLDKMLYFVTAEAEEVRQGQKVN